ncbi:phospholipase-like protein [Tanacetum coccineum]|uniref:Phospholipase-like protein n=1 Tax=Tanacetum coccineum TaxID=301880 RepID=A0ABQ5E0F6_9ASTR
MIWREYLSRSVVGRCKFPWCNDISVDRSFWHGLCGLDDIKKGWLVDEVFIPINEPKRHWSLAMFHICSGIVTFYDIEKSNATHDKEFRPWYLKMRQCLEEKIFVVLKETGVSIRFPLGVDDPVQAALAYREKMIRFYFQHKMFCP